MMNVVLGVVNGTTIVTQTCAGDLDQLVQLTLGSHAYTRSPPLNGGYPTIGPANGVTVPAQIYTGTIAPGATIWAYADEARALIGSGAATATGQTKGGTA